jgi:hypothetical protein
MIKVPLTGMAGLQALELGWVYELVGYSERLYDVLLHCHSVSNE